MNSAPMQDWPKVSNIFYIMSGNIETVITKFSTYLHATITSSLDHVFLFLACLGAGVEENHKVWNVSLYA